MTPYRKLTLELLAATPLSEDRCPHLRESPDGCWCASGSFSEPPKAARRLVCDNMSLQLWCLDKKSFAKCIFYKDPSEFHDEPTDAITIRETAKQVRSTVH